MPHMFRAILAVALLAGFLPASSVPAQTAEICFPETNHCVEGRFRQYWEQNGGVPVFGFPIINTRSEFNRDLNRPVLTQWFERNRLEAHPDNAVPYDVLLGRLGHERLLQLGRAWQSEPRHEGQAPGCLWFEETRLNVCDQEPGRGFRTYWETHGLNDPTLSPYGQSLALFGLPLTSPQMETNQAGDTVMTQWFERARFEWHPNNPEQYRVLLGLLGREVGPPSHGPSPDTTRQTVTVKNVVDGDTIDVDRAGQIQRVRFIGVDTPEIHGRTDCFGAQASDYTKSRLVGKTVQLEKDVSETDQYGRLLRYVWLDGTLFNELLVYNGYARVSTYPPDVKYQNRFLEAERAARLSGAGLWSACAAPAPTATPTPRPAPTATPTRAPAANCHASYPTVCIPPPPPDLDCKDIPYRNFRVLPPDPHRFDSDKDGIGCET